METVLSSQLYKIWYAYWDENDESHSNTVAYDQTKTLEEQLNAILADESVYEAFVHYVRKDGTFGTLFRWDSQINVRKLNSHALFYMPREQRNVQFIDQVSTDRAISEH